MEIDNCETLHQLLSIVQNTLSLRVTRSGTKKPDTTYSCIRLLSTGGSPVSFMFFVNFSQFDLDFMSFAIV